MSSANSISELKSEIKAILENELSSLVVQFIIKDEDELKKQTVNITSSNDTIENLMSMYKNSLIHNVLEEENIEIIDLSTTDDRIDAIYRYDLEEKPKELELINYEECDELDFNNFDMNSIVGYLIQIGTHDRNIVLFKKQYPIGVIKRKQTLKEMLFKKTNTQLEEIREDILRLSSKFDFIYIFENLYICNLKELERFTGFTAIIKKEAKETISIIDDSGLLTDSECLNDELENLPFVRKLTKIKKDSPVLNLEKKKIFDFAKKKNLGLKMDGEEGFYLDTKKSKQTFLKLLNDDFLHSELTELEYETKAKDKRDS